MQTPLSLTEIRVLGVLIEKEITTPEYYPLTLNALTNACNQKSNREPVLSFGENEVAQAFEAARQKGLTRLVEVVGSRTNRLRQLFTEVLNLTHSQTAVLCELMLRGAQTLGEIKGRAERMYEFQSLAEVETVLNELAALDNPLVIRLPRQTGQKDVRFMHLLAGEADVAAFHAHSMSETSSAPTNAKADTERLAALETQVAALYQELADLRQEFAAFKRQFE